MLGSLPLLSFRVGGVESSDNVTRKFAFKVWLEDNENGNEEDELRGPVVFCMQAEHSDTRTYYFSSDSHEEQQEWIGAMSQAADVDTQPPQSSETSGTTTDLSSTMVTKVPDPQTPQIDSDSQPPPQPNGNGHETPSPFTACSRKDNTNSLSTEAPREMEGGVSAHIKSHPNGWGSNSTVLRTSAAQSHHQERTVPPQETVVLRRGFVPRTAPERVAQRRSSMAQLQQWVNQRRGMASQEDLHSPSRYYMLNRGLSEYYGYPPGPQYMDEYPLYPGGMRESICTVSGVGGYDHHWSVEDKRRSLRDGPQQQYGPTMMRDFWRPQHYGVEASMRRLSLQPRSRSVPRSPSSSSGGLYSPLPPNYVSPARSPSTRFDHDTVRMRDDNMYVDHSVYSLPRSLSSPKYDFPGSRRSLNQGLYHCSYPVSPSIHNKMGPLYHDPYSRELHPTLKLNEIETSKLLGRLCEQNCFLKDQETLVHRLRMDKGNLEDALLSTHQEMELHHHQPLAMEKLQFKKETLQNQLINIRGELSQASSALTTARMEFEALEDEANAIHGDLWEQLNAGGQSALVRNHIQKEFWRVQDVLEALHKNNSSRGTNTAKHKVVSGDSFSTNSPASPLSSVSLTSPLSPFSPLPGSQTPPSKHPENMSDAEDTAQDRQSSMNKVGIVPPRTKSPTDEPDGKMFGGSRYRGRAHNGISRERPKSAVFPAEVKSKMTVEEQNQRLRRNLSKRQSLNLSGHNYKVVPRRLTAHEIDIKDLEAAVRGEGLESPSEEIARLRRLQVEPELYDQVLAAERLLEAEDTVPLSAEEQQEKQRKLERLRTLIAKSNLQNIVPALDGPVEGGASGSSQQQLQEQEKRIEISCALAAEASRRSRLLSARCAPSPPTTPTRPPSKPNSANVLKA